MNPARSRTIAFAAVATLSASLPAFAQVIPPSALPGSALPGRERQQFQEQPPARAQPGGPAIKLPSTVAPEGADRIVLVLRGVQIEGATIYRPEEMQTLYQDLVGHQVTLTAVYDIAQRLTAKYGNDGYVLTRAVVPPQELSPDGAIVRIQVIEGYIDHVEWPAAVANYRDFFADYTARIIADRPTNIRTLERYLLLAGDLPGLKFKNSLKPSATKPGAATLVVEVVEKPIDALARVDNRGTRSRGPFEFFGSTTINNALRMHDAFTLNAAGSFQTRELIYAGGSWRQVLTSEGLTAFVNGSYSWGHPGLPVSPLLDYKTRSAFVEGGFSYPFIRLRERNLTGTVLGFASDDQSDSLGAPLIRDRLRGVRVKADADAADPWNGINQLNLVFSQGIDGLGSSKNGNFVTITNGTTLLSRQNGRVDFSKFEATATRLQPLPASFSVLAAVYGQYAFTPLLAPELCGYGGRVFGRAFAPSTLLGDSCVELLGELRYDLPAMLKQLTQTQLYGFADRGWLHNIATTSPTGANVDGASVGGGLRLGWLTDFTGPTAFNADLSAAKGVAGPHQDWRFFFIVTGRY